MVVPVFAPVFVMGASVRGFTISPAVSGKTKWDLDADGPLTLATSGSWTIVPFSGFAGDVKLNGGGGGGAGVAGTPGAGGNGGATSFAGMTAGGGSGSTAVASSTPGAGGAGGVASSGSTNTNGTAGGNGQTGSESTGGSGGASPNGGGTSTGPFTSDNGSISGNAGNAPGGGGSGAVTGANVSSSRRAPGGGGGGAYVRRIYAVGDLTGSQTLIVGSGGVAGLGTSRGGAGAVGKASIT